MAQRVKRQKADSAKATTGPKREKQGAASVTPRGTRAAGAPARPEPRKKTAAATSPANSTKAATKVVAKTAARTAGKKNVKVGNVKTTAKRGRVKPAATKPKRTAPRPTSRKAGTRSARTGRRKGGRVAAPLPPPVMKVKELVPQNVCGQGTTVEQLFRVDEVAQDAKRTRTVHLVFLDRHGWYCEHGTSCPALREVMKLGKQLLRAS